MSATFSGERGGHPGLAAIVPQVVYDMLYPTPAGLSGR
jgi:hypothetical protein